MPYVKPIAARFIGSAAKSFSHGYAQTVIAASQSSYAAQNTTPSHLTDALVGRFRKAERNQLHGLSNLKDGARHVSTAAERSGTNAEHQEIKQYIDAWQKHQRSDAPWQQFQFARRIEWQPPSTVPEATRTGKQSAEVEDVVVVREEEDSSPRMRRSYTTTALDNFGKAFVDEAAEAVALAQVNEAIAEEIQRSKGGLASLASKDSAESLELSSQSGQQSISSPATVHSVSESDIYTEALTSLAESKQYDRIPAVFQALLRAGVQQPAPAAYRALLSSAIELTQGKHQKVPKALEVYSDMLRRKVLPDVATYGMLIGLLAKRSSDAVVMRKGLEERLTRYGGLEQPGSFIFRSSQSEHSMLAEDNSLNMALKMFDRASALPETVDSEACASLVTACADAGRFEDMDRVYQHMEASAVEPPTSLYPTIIAAYGQKGDLKRSVETYDQYKELAIANNAGENDIIRNDNAVYAALIKAYGAADRLKGGLKFLASVQAGASNHSEVETLREVVALQALLPLALRDSTFSNALDLTNSLNGRALASALTIVCINSADRNLVEISTNAFDALAKQSSDLAHPATAMLAMHVRNTNIAAAEPFWSIIESAPASLTFIEPTTMRTVALIGSGQAERGLRHSRRMFARVRDSQLESKQVEAVEQIDEAIEVVGNFMLKSAISPSAAASAELLRMMTENGGLVSPIAEHTIARFGPEQIRQLSNADVELLLRIQSSLIMDEAAADIAGPARFGCLLETVVTRQMMPSTETEAAIERTLINIDQSKLSQLWNNYRYPQTPVFSPASFSPIVPVRQATFDDSFDPYASKTDVKGSNVINELLERPQAKRMAEALTKFRNMRRVGRVPRMFTYGKLIEAATKENNMTLAHDVLEMAKQDVPFDGRYRVVRFGWQQILDHMVAGCLNLGRRDLAARYHQDLIDMGAAPSANTYGLYITTLKENTKTFDEASEAVKIFLRAKAEGVEPSSFLYNALIGKLGKARRIDDCLFYFAEMRNLGVRPTSVTYGTIVNALCRVSDDKFAEEIFEEMEGCANYKPRPAPYHSLMQFFLTTKRDRSKVLNYYERMRSKGIEPTMHTYKLLIDTHATLGPVDMEAAENVLADMHSAGFQPTAVHYASLIHAKGCVLHDMEGARATFDSVISNGTIRPEPCLYQALFESMNANHSIADAEPFLVDMSRRGIEFTPYIANALIHGWTLEKNAKKAREAFERVPRGRREPSTYEAMVRACLAAEDRDAAKEVVKEALSRGYPSAVAGKIAELVR